MSKREKTALVRQNESSSMGSPPSPTSSADLPVSQVQDKRYDAASHAEDLEVGQESSMSRLSSGQEEHPIPVDTVRSGGKHPSATSPETTAMPSPVKASVVDRSILLALRPKPPASSASPETSPSTTAPVPKKSDMASARSAAEALPTALTETDKNTTSNIPQPSLGTSADQATSYHSEASRPHTPGQDVEQNQGMIEDEGQWLRGAGVHSRNPANPGFRVGDSIEYTVHQRPAIVHEEIIPRTHTVYEPTVTYSVHIHEHRTLYQPIVDTENSQR